MVFEECGRSPSWYSMQHELEVSSDNPLSRFMVYLSKINMLGRLCFFFPHTAQKPDSSVLHLIIRYSSFLQVLRDYGLWLLSCFNTHRNEISTYLSLGGGNWMHPPSILDGRECSVYQLSKFFLPIWKSELQESAVTGQTRFLGPVSFCISFVVQ